MADEGRFHTKYRPKSLDEVIGNTANVDRLKGIIESRKFPSAIIFTGPPGCGKTTIARAFVESCNGSLDARNFSELNMAESRSIEEVRALIQISKMRPVGAPRRFILCDEVHQLISNAPAANAFLKPLEEPPAQTTYLLCSMEPEKFRGNNTGRAIYGRCMPMMVQAPTDAEKRSQLMRIAKGEEITFLGKEERTKIVQNSTSMRDIAMQMESVASYYAGLKEKPERLGVDAIDEALSLTSANTSVVVARFLLALYGKKFVAVFNQVLDIENGFQFITEAMNMHFFVMTMIYRNGDKHPKVWGAPPAWTLLENAKKLFDNEKAPVDRPTQISRLAVIQARLAKLKAEASAFAVDERSAISAAAWEMIQTMD